MCLKAKTLKPASKHCFLGTPVLVEPHDSETGRKHGPRPTQRSRLTLRLTGAAGGEALLWGHLQTPLFPEQTPPGSPRAACAEGTRRPGSGRPTPSQAGRTLGRWAQGAAPQACTPWSGPEGRRAAGVVLLPASTCCSASPDERGSRFPTTILYARSARGRLEGKRAQNCQQRLAPPPSPAVSSERPRHSPGRTPTTLPSTLSSGTFSITPKPISQIRKWEHREVKEPAQGHSARRWRARANAAEPAHTARRPPWAPSSSSLRGPQLLEPQGARRRRPRGTE